MPTAPSFTAGQVLTAAQMNVISALLCPTGSVLPFAGSTAPTNFLLCYGQAVSRTTYADLFTVCGTTYGAGDGTTTFNLPDLRGRAAAGKDDMGGTAAGRLTSTVLSASNTLGATGGAQTVTLSTSEMPSHSHTVTDPGFVPSVINISVSAGATGYYGRGSSQALYTDSKGSSSAHNNTQPTLVLNYIIKI